MRWFPLILRSRRCALAAAAAGILAGCASGPALPAPSPGVGQSAFPDDSLDRFIHRVVERIPDLPGLAVVVVRDTGTVYLGAAGFADLESRRPAAPGTPYYLASSTKSFTAMAAAVLAARGRLDLDAPLSRYLPELHLPPDRPADSVTVRQLLTHTMGLSNDAVVIRTAYTGEHSARALTALLAGSRVTDRSFHYDNLGYVMASLVFERVAGRRWQDLLDGLVFEPLGMSRTTAYMSRARRWGVAVPYWAGAEARPRALPAKRDATMHAAGGVVSSAADLGRWLIANLAGGRVGGSQVLPAEAVREAHRLQVRLPHDVAFGPFRRYGYGLGWYWSDYGGDTLLHHFGSYDGARAHVSFMPDRRIGVAVLVNASGPVAGVADLVATYAYDLLLGKPGAAGGADSLLSSLAERVSVAKQAIAAERQRIAGRPSTLTRAAADYAWRYVSREVGEMDVGVAGGALAVTLGPLAARAEYFTRPDAVRVEFGPGRGEVIQFFPSARGVDSLGYEGYVFRR